MATKRTEIEKTLIEFIGQKKWTNVSSTCEEWEHQCFEFESEPFYNVQLLSYLIQNQLNDARFLWKRIPKSLKETDPELTAIWNIGKQMWKKNYEDFYKSLSNFNWGPGNVHLIQALAESFRQRSFELVALAYESISTQDFAILLGINEQEAIERAKQVGWTYDATSKTICPSVNKIQPVRTTNLDQLQQLTEYVVWLEQK